MRAICLIVGSISISNIQIILKSIFTTALNENDGINDDMKITACENAKRYLKERIATHNI